MSTTIIRITSSNIPALIVTSHCCSYVRRDGNWIPHRVRPGPGAGRQEPGTSSGAHRPQRLHHLEWRQPYAVRATQLAVPGGQCARSLEPRSCSASSKASPIWPTTTRSIQQRSLGNVRCRAISAGIIWREVLNQCHTLTGSKTRSGAIPDRQARENRSRHLPNLTKPQIVTACPSRRSKQNHNGKSGRVPRAWGWRAGRP